MQNLPLGAIYLCQEPYRYPMLSHWFMQTAEREKHQSNQVSAYAPNSIILISTIPMGELPCVAFFSILQPDSTQLSGTMLTRTKSHELISTWESSWECTHRIDIHVMSRALDTLTWKESRRSTFNYSFLWSCAFSLLIFSLRPSTSLNACLAACESFFRILQLGFRVDLWVYLVLGLYEK